MITKEIHDSLVEIVRFKGRTKYKESFNEVINRLLDRYEELESKSVSD